MKKTPEKSEKNKAGKTEKKEVKSSGTSAVKSRTANSGKSVNSVKAVNKTASSGKSGAKGQKTVSQKAVPQKPSRDHIQELLVKKAALKQDIFQDTKRDFERFKKHIQQEVSNLRLAVQDERIRLYSVDNGDFEIQVFIGSDVLVFHMHTNIFKLPDEHELWKSDYMQKDRERGFFGIINIYNFLAASYLKNRVNDLGYLIGRIFINKEDHFMVEGKGHLGTDFKDLKHDRLEDDEICRIIHTSFVYALEFDLLTPPYDVVAKVSVSQMQDTQTNDQISTGKRLGFKFGAEDRGIF